MEYIVRCLNPQPLPRRRPRKTRKFTTESATRMIQAAARGLLTRDAMVLEEAWAAYIQVHVRAFLERRRQEDQRCFGLVGWWRRLRSRRPDGPEMVNTWGEPRYSTQNACDASMDAEFTASQTRTVAYDFVETAAFAPGGGATPSLPPRQAQLTA